LALLGIDLQVILF